MLKDIKRVYDISLHLHPREDQTTNTNKLQILSNYKYYQSTNTTELSGMTEPCPSNELYLKARTS